MADVVVNDQIFNDIANGIREKTGVTTTYTPEEMPTGIDDVYVKAFDDGCAEGERVQREIFWNTYLNNGNSVNGTYLFYAGRFDDGNFYPTCNIKVSNANNMFRSSRITKLKEILEKCNAVLDTSPSSDFTNAFYYCRSPILPEISTVNCETLTSTFVSTYLVHLELVLKDDGSQTFASTFTDATALTELYINGGVIGKSFSVQTSPLLTAVSARSIFEHLKNYAGTSYENKYTVKVHNNVWIRINEEETPPDGYDDWETYVQSLGWKI